MRSSVLYKLGYRYWFILLWSATPCVGQLNSDSLFSAWQNTELADTVRLEALHQYIWSDLLFYDPDSAFKLAQMHYNYAEDHRLEKYMGQALSDQGVSFAIKGNNEEAARYYKRSLELFERVGYKKGIASNTNNLGNIYSDQGDLNKAVEAYVSSVKIMEEIGNMPAVAKGLVNIGRIYSDLGDYSKALEYLNSSYNLAKENSYVNSEISALNSIGILFNKIMEYEQAVKYFNQCNALITEDNEDYYILKSNILHNLGTSHDYLEDDELALKFYNESLELKEQINNPIEIATTLNNIGTIYLDRDSFDLALDYFNRSYELYLASDYSGEINTPMNNIAEVKFQQGHYAEAISYARKSLEIAQSSGIPEDISKASYVLYQSYKASGNKSASLKMLELFQEAQDSLLNEKNQKEILAYSFRKEYRQKQVIDSLKAHQIQIKAEAQIATQKVQLEKERIQRLALYGGMVILLVSGGFIYNRYRITRSQKKIIEHEKHRSEQLLLNILPAEIAEELKEHGEAEARDIEMATILFSDFKGFTQAAAKLKAKDLVHEINASFKAFDGIAGKYGIEKIKTIGDAYMAAGGLPVPTEDSVKNTVLAAIEMQEFITARSQKQKANGQPHFLMRVGIHTGPVVAGIVGVKKFQYDVWGDTVNTASRLESQGAVGRVNISEATFKMLKDLKDENDKLLFSFENRGKIEAKGKGAISMYFVELKSNLM